MGASTKEQTCQTSSRTKQHQLQHDRDQRFGMEKRCSSQTFRSTVQQLGCKACPLVSRGATPSVRHSDECRQSIMEAVEADAEGSFEDTLGQEPSMEASSRDCWRRRYRGCSANGEDSGRSFGQQQQCRRGSTLTDGTRERRDDTA